MKRKGLMGKLVVCVDDLPTSRYRLTAIHKSAVDRVIRIRENNFSELNENETLISWTKLLVVRCMAGFSALRAFHQQTEEIVRRRPKIWQKFVLWRILMFCAYFIFHFFYT